MTALRCELSADAIERIGGWISERGDESGRGIYRFEHGGDDVITHHQSRDPHQLDRSLSGVKMVKDSRQRSEIPTNNHSKSFGSLFADELEYDPKPVILEMLQHYAETGDIQTVRSFFPPKFEI